MAAASPPREPFDERTDSFSAKRFQRTVGVVYIIWGVLIILWSDINVFVKREDIIGLAQTTSALAAISLTGLTILQDRGTTQRFLRVLLAAITMIFVLATTVGWISVLLVTISDFQPVKLTVGVFIGLGFTFYGAVSFLPPDTFGVRVLGFMIPFVLPLQLVLFPRDLFAVTLALSLGGMIYLLVSSAALTLVTWKR